MKKVVLIALAVVMAVVLAVVVVEVIEIVTYSVPTVRASSKTAYVVAYDGGFWFEADGDVNAATAVGHDAGTPIPADYDVVIATGWIGTSLDQIKSTSQNIKMRIPEAGIDMSYDRGVGGPSDSTAFGSGPTLYDQYWVKLLFPITGFKPQSGAQVYAVHWGGAADRRRTAGHEPHRRREAPPGDLHRLLRRDHPGADDRPGRYLRWAEDALPRQAGHECDCSVHLHRGSARGVSRAPALTANTAHHRQRPGPAASLKRFAATDPPHPLWAAPSRSARCGDGSWESAASTRFGRAAA